VTVSRLTGFVALVVLMSTLAGAPASPALAQTDDSTTTTTTPTTEPPPPDTTPTTLPPLPIDPGVSGDAPPESVPVVPDTVPPREAPAPSGPSSVVPPQGRVVKVDLRGARANAVARQAAYEAAVAHRTDLENTLATLQDQVGQIQGASAQAVRDLADAKTELRDRAVAAYVRGGSNDVVPDLSAVDLEAELQRGALIGAVVDRDRDAVDRVKALQAKLTRDQANTAAQLTDTQSQLDQARVDEAQAQFDLFNAKLDLAVSTVGGSLVIHGFVFPVADPHTFQEDFGDARLPGTEFAHTHQGCDVVAAEGTELYAAERGVITQISDSTLGGHGLWIKGESGTYYYYAHLSAYAKNLRGGQIVEAGDLVGYVGHTGDAYGPHLHFEVHPNGGPAIDPYPLLLVADQQRLQGSPQP
jgi:murein DD-endopeptidase MepM/ murein hydrolase activator NlpD